MRSIRRIKGIKRGRSVQKEASVEINGDSRGAAPVNRPGGGGRKAFQGILAAGLALTLLLSAPSTETACGASLPEDVAGQPYEAAVSALMEKGIVTGDEDGRFHPLQELTRAQACVLVVKSMGLPDALITGTATQAPAGNGFSDMAGYGWAAGHIGYAAQNGIAKGYPDGTFRPGGKVTLPELATMLLRAGGYTDGALSGSWPQNYVEKARELGLYEGLPEEAALPEAGVRWMAVQMTYRSLPMIEGVHAGTPTAAAVWGAPAAAPEGAGWSFLPTGRFDASASVYAGLPLARDAQVLAYGEKAGYAQEMSLSARAEDYRLKSALQYKNAVTPALIRKEEGRVAAMILPADAGFTGRAYSVVNSLSDGLLTLTAGAEMQWYYAKDAKAITSAVQAAEGTLYCLTVEEGQVTTAEAVKDMASGFQTVADYRQGGSISLRMAGGSREIYPAAAPTVYLVKAEGKNRYQTGSLSDIRPGVNAKLYDISEDGLSRADIILLWP